jgi:hypothetical protein
MLRNKYLILSRFYLVLYYLEKVLLWEVRVYESLIEYRVCSKVMITLEIHITPLFIEAESNILLLFCRGEQ